MTDPDWAGVVRYHRGRVLGWVGYDSAKAVWYARTSGTRTHPTARGEFDNEQAARDFLQFITSVENLDANT